MTVAEMRVIIAQLKTESRSVTNEKLIALYEKKLKEITSKRLYIKVADAHIQAAQKGKFDYPSGYWFKDITQIKQLLREGKTIEDVYTQCIASFGTITGGVLNSFLGHASKSTTSAVRKGMRKLLTEN